MELSQFTTYLQMFSSFLVAFTGAVVAVGAFIKPIRNWIVEKLSHQSRYERMEEYVSNICSQLDRFAENQALIKSAQVATLRKDLTDIYNDAVAKGYIDEYDRKDFIEMYQIYDALGGNCYVHELHEKILEMPGKPAKKTVKKATKKRG